MDARSIIAKLHVNQMRLMIHHCAYWLMWTLQAACPKRSRWRRAQFDTLRLHLIKVVATVVEKKSRIVMSLSAKRPHQSLFRFLFDALAPPHMAPPFHREVQHLQVMGIGVRSV